VQPDLSKVNKMHNFANNMQQQSTSMR